MEKNQQTDFLANLDTGQPIAVTKKKSPKQIELDQLLEDKSKLTKEIDNCVMCDGGQGYRCSSEHPQDWAILLKKIEALEKSISTE